MDIKKYLIIFLFSLTSVIYAQDKRFQQNINPEIFDSLPKKVTTNNSVEDAAIKNITISNNAHFEVIKQSIVIYDGDNSIPSSPNIFKLGDYKYEIYSNMQKPLLTHTTLNKRKDLKLAFIPGTTIYKISDGSIMVGYKDSLDILEFVSNNKLVLKYHFPEINTLILSSNNFETLNNLLIKLRQNPLVISARLNLLDPSIRPF